MRALTVIAASVLAASELTGQLPSARPESEFGYFLGSTNSFVGRTFVAPVGLPGLVSFGYFTLIQEAAQADIEISAMIMEWALDRPVGPVLWSTPARSIDPSPHPIILGASYFRFFQFTDFYLRPGGQYIVFLSAADWRLANPESSLNTIIRTTPSFVPRDPLPLGGAVTFSGTDPRAGAWRARSEDVQLGMQFTPVPEPSTWILLSAGLVGVLGISRRRRACDRLAE